LNSRYWLEAQFRMLRREPDELTRLAGIAKILGRTDPGPGGFYDDLGNPARQAHLVPGLKYEDDPAFFASPRASSMAFGGQPTSTHSDDGIRPDGPQGYAQFPKEWWSYEETRFEQTLTLAYHHLEKSRAYRLRVVYVQRRSVEPRIKLVANGKILVQPYSSEKPARLPMAVEREFDLPPDATATGDLELQWQAEPGGGGVGAGPMIAEVLLLPK
jgi:hypothetical protein